MWLMMPPHFASNSKMAMSSAFDSLHIRIHIVGWFISFSLCFSLSLNLNLIYVRDFCSFPNKRIITTVNRRLDVDSFIRFKAFEDMLVRTWDAWKMESLLKTKSNGLVGEWGRTDLQSGMAKIKLNSQVFQRYQLWVHWSSFYFKDAVLIHAGKTKHKKSSKNHIIDHCKAIKRIRVNLDKWLG